MQPHQPTIFSLLGLENIQDPFTEEQAKQHKQYLALFIAIKLLAQFTDDEVEDIHTIEELLESARILYAETEAVYQQYLEEYIQNFRDRKKVLSHDGDEVFTQSSSLSCADETVNQELKTVRSEIKIDRLNKWSRSPHTHQVILSELGVQ